MRETLGTKQGRLLGGVLLLSALLFAAGCGSSTQVSGKVTYQGKTVPSGIVVFYGANNWTGNSPIEEDGSYTIVKAPPGPVKITVDTSFNKPPRLPANAPKMPNMANMPKDMKPPEMPKEAQDNPLYNPKGQANLYVAIPEKYADPEKSGLTYEVKSGKQNHDIELK